LWTEIAGRPLDWMKEVDGYNLSYRRDWASQGLISQDEFAAPLVAWGQRGSGRTAAVGFPLGGDYSERIRAWPQYGDFVQTLVRWLMGQPLPPGLGLRPEVKGTELALDLRYDDGPWTETFAAQAPRILLAQGARAEPGLELTWQRMAPGHYRATMELEEGVVVRGGIQAGTQVIPFGPLAAGTNAEWTFDPARQEELRQTAAASGGRELLDLAAAWQSPPLPQFRDLRPWILPLLLLLLLADALITRLGWNFPGIPWPRAAALPRSKSSPLTGSGVAPPRTKSPESSRPVFTAELAAPVGETPPPPSPPPDAASEESRRRARFARAKKGS
jgi:hypothetical protein